MKSTLFTILALVIISLSSYAQDSNDFNTYTFKLENITDANDAKEMINQMRTSTKEKIFYFNDATDTFTLKTKNQYEVGEFVKILTIKGFRPITR